MANLNFESMSYDELTTYKSGIKAQVNALHVQARAASVVQARRVHE